MTYTEILNNTPEYLQGKINECINNLPKEENTDQGNIRWSMREAVKKLLPPEISVNNTYLDNRELELFLTNNNHKVYIKISTKKLDKLEVVSKTRSRYVHTIGKATLSKFGEYNYRLPVMETLNSDDFSLSIKGNWCRSSDPIYFDLLKDKPISDSIGSDSIFPTKDREKLISDMKRDLCGEVCKKVFQIKPRDSWNGPTQPVDIQNRVEFFKGQGLHVTEEMVSDDNLISTFIEQAYLFNKQLIDGIIDDYLNLRKS